VSYSTDKGLISRIYKELKTHWPTRPSPYRPIRPPSHRTARPPLAGLPGLHLQACQLATEAGFHSMGPPGLCPTEQPGHHSPACWASTLQTCQAATPSGHCPADPPGQHPPAGPLAHQLLPTRGGLQTCLGDADKQDWMLME
jgi:hypothetical protein